MDTAKKNAIISYMNWALKNFKPNDPLTIDCCKPAIQEEVRQQETNMYEDLYEDATITTNQITAEERKGLFLRDELTSAICRKDRKARQHFGLSDDDPPESASEFVKRIQDGKFVLDEKYKDLYTRHYAEYIRWRDPAKQEDNDGYMTWDKQDQDARNTARRLIVVSSPTEGLKALQDYEAITIQ